jgi:outer membrane protein assembly factor BamB
MRRSRWFWALVLTVPFLLGACDWGQLHFDATSSNYNPSEPALTAASVQHLTQAWASPDADADIVVANGVVYTHRTIDLFSPDTAKAFDVSTGAVKWTSTVPHLSIPVAAGSGLVYYTRFDRGTVALDAPTGAQQWSRPEVALTLDGTRLFASSSIYYFGTGQSSTVVAIDPAGKTLWSVVGAGETTGAVVQGGHLVVVSYVALDSSPGGVVLVSTYDQSNGALLHRVSVAARSATGAVKDPTAPVAGGSLIYFKTSDSNDLYAVDPSSGAVAWHLATPGIQGVAVTPNAVVITAAGSASSSTVTARNPATGATLWTANPTGNVEPPKVAGNLVFVGHTGSDPSAPGMLVYDLASGSLVTSSTTVCCGPIPTAGHVFVLGGNGLQAMVPAPQ